MAIGILFNFIVFINNIINYIVKVKDGINRLFVNFFNNVIGIKDGKYIDYVNGEYLIFSIFKGVFELFLIIFKSLLKNIEDILYFYIIGSGGINFVIFISNDIVILAFIFSVIGFVYYIFYIVVVDDYMNLILNFNNLILIDLGYVINISNLFSLII